MVKVRVRPNIYLESFGNVGKVIVEGVSYYTRILYKLAITVFQCNSTFFSFRAIEQIVDHLPLFT